ncbi:MAG TPA: SAM-dependent chlorinase/fluorinase [Acidobacteriaceae bacterium]
MPQRSALRLSSRSGFRAILFTVVALLFAFPALPAQTVTAPRVIGFMTDFDVKDDAVGICKAVMFGIAPQAKIIDITHQVTPFDIAQAGRFLAGSAPYFPHDAVFVAVIDPTVGSTRKAIIVKSKVGQYFVLPDNGMITQLANRDGLVGAREITNPAWMIGAKLSSTFHGRDIFSPAGAHLARGDDWTSAGPALDLAKLVRLQNTSATTDASGLHGQVIGTDGPFGNLVTNVPAATFAKLGYTLGDRVPVTIAGISYVLPFVKTFSDVPVGEGLLYIDSRGRLSVGIDQGNFADVRHVAPPVPIEIPAKR